MASLHPPAFRIATAASCCYRLCSGCFRFSKNFLPIAPTKARSFTPHWQQFYLASKRKSSNVPTKPKALSLCQNAGSLNAPSLGSIVAADWPRIGSVSTVKLSLSSNSLPFVSCSENFAIPHKVSGRTLSMELCAVFASARSFYESCLSPFYNKIRMSNYISLRFALQVS